MISDGPPIVGPAIWTYKRRKRGGGIKDRMGRELEEGSDGTATWQLGIGGEDAGIIREISIIWGGGVTWGRHGNCRGRIWVGLGRWQRTFLLSYFSFSVYLIPVAVYWFSTITVKRGIAPSSLLPSQC